jgi:acyl-CoA synthetase (NDP forming)
MRIEAGVLQSIAHGMDSERELLLTLLAWRGSVVGPWCSYGYKTGREVVFLQVAAQCAPLGRNQFAEVFGARLIYESSRDQTDQW